MADNINILTLASAMARHAAQRHNVLSENIANSDTPNYKAKDLEPFAEAFMRISQSGQSFSQQLNNAHGNSIWREETITGPGITSPNGNTVSLEDQMMRSIEAQQDHMAATAIYKKAVGLLRTSLGRGA
ncbi:MAG: FlgB family protein [Alphaproteobacteria bacterium]|nr:FlgB family protein [Marinicaulis sp.]NOX94422.1 FlgB family protein [Alphaproteobacteria bacterium]